MVDQPLDALPSNDSWKVTEVVDPRRFSEFGRSADLKSIRLTLPNNIFHPSFCR